jgi:5-methylthioadenosine/S-adenosylhomocysteine deaminase
MKLALDISTFGVAAAALRIELIQGHAIKPCLGGLTVKSSLRMAQVAIHPAGLRLGMEPSLSVDVECTLTADFFTQMRSMMNMQRVLVNQQVLEQGNFYPPNQWPTPAPGTPALLTTRDVLRYGTINGAKALRLENKTGSLTPGKEADISILDATAINVAPLNQVPGAVVSLMDRTNVETVVVAGKVRKWKGRLLDVDLNRLRSQLEDSRDYIFAKANVPKNLFSSQ